MSRCPERLSTILLGLAIAAGAGGCKTTSDTQVPEGSATGAEGDGSAVGIRAPAEILAETDLPTTIEQPLADDPMKVTIHRLSNGMTVYVSTERQKPRFVSWIGVRAGSRMDPPDSTGLAHYLEHMLFKGTDEYGTLDPEKEAPHVEAIRQLYNELRDTDDENERAGILAKIDDETQEIAKYAVPNEHSRMYSAIGVEGINAFTSFEQTVYVSDVPANRVEAWATVESERFTDPIFRLFYPELEAVYEEKNLSLDNPYRRVSEARYRALFPKHPYGTQTTIGSVEHLKNPAYQDMSDYFDRWYVPNNMAIAVAGDIDAETVVPLLEKKFGHLQPKPVPKPHAGTITPLDGRVVKEVVAEGQEAVSLSWVTVPTADADEPALFVMDRILDDSSVGLLNVELELSQKVPSVYSSHSTLNEGGYFTISANARDGQDHEEIEKMILEVIARLKKGDFTDADIQAIKLQQDIREKRTLEGSYGRVSKMMSAFIDHRDWSDVIARDKRVREITKAEVVAVANKYLTDNYVVIRKKKGTPEVPKLAKPTITPVPIDPQRKSEFAKKIESMPATELEPEFVEEGKHYVHRKLPAGDLIAVKNERNDLFSVTYQFKRGYRKEPMLCYALDLFELTDAGDTKAEQLQKKMYAMGTSVSTRCDAEYSSVTLQGVDAKLEDSLALFQEWISDPRFDAGTQERHFENTLTRRRNIMEQDWSLTSALDLYGKYGKRSAWLAHPSNDKLEKVKAKKLTKLMTSLMDYEHRTMYFGPRAPAAAAKAVERKGKFKKTGDVRLRKYVDTKNSTIYVLHKDGAKANVRFTIPRGPLPRDSRPVARMLSEYLSGSMSALVFQEIRESRGLAYSAYSTYSSGTRPKDESGLLAFMSTQADKTPDAVDAMLGLMQSKTIQPERLVTAKAAMEQEYRSSRIDPRFVYWWVVDWDERGEKEDPRPWEWSVAKKLKASDVEAFAAPFADTPVIITVVGDRERIGMEQLSKFGQVVEVKADQLFSYGDFPEPEKEKPAKKGKPAKVRKSSTTKSSTDKARKKALGGKK
jgi:predicted Zn-dependent peptidase